MKQLTIQLLGDHGWRDVAVLELPRPEEGAAGPCLVEYDFDYAVQRLRDVGPGERGRHAIAWRVPVDTTAHRFGRWPAFLDDVRPGGAARRWWVSRLGLGFLPEPEQDVPLLERGAIAPIGNLRIKQAVPNERDVPIRFPLAAVVDRDHDFLDHAAEMGASVGGATGAGGEAPKLLLRVSDADEVWIDTWQDLIDVPDRHYLVKFARNQRSDIDRTVLRSEYVYYRALAELGVDTVDVDAMRLIEGEREPSLWLPRFDVDRREGREVRYGVESLYSLIDAPPGSWQKHQTYLAALREVFREQPDFDPSALVVEYLWRDLLNLVFGNTDNHGRNAAVLKTPEGMRLAPVYDFAPMKMDPEGVVRTTRWDQFERGGHIDWAGLIDSLDAYADPDAIRSQLQARARKLIDLPERLRRLGLPEETLRFPPMGLDTTERKLERWGLL